MYVTHSDTPLPQDVEIAYYSSLRLLTQSHGIEVNEHKDKAYPYNILLSYWESTRALNRQPIETTLHIVRDDSERVRVATKQVFEAGHTLYFVPVMPLFRLFLMQEQKRCAELLLSVFAYLYHEVQIPYHRDVSSYLFYQYDIHKDWLLDCAGDYEREEFEANMSEIIKNEYVGDEMERKIHNRYQLAHFGERLSAFRPKTLFERDALRVATEAWELWQDYPDATVFRNVSDIDPYECDEIASFDRYVSFVGDVDGWLYTNIERCISDELNEYGETQQPCKVQVFDDPEADKATGLEFEHRLFDLICELTTLLTNLP